MGLEPERRGGFVEGKFSRSTGELHERAFQRAQDIILQIWSTGTEEFHGILFKRFSGHRSWGNLEFCILSYYGLNCASKNCMLRSSAQCLRM